MNIDTTFLRRCIATLELAQHLKRAGEDDIIYEHDWARLPQQFHREIERSHIVLFAHAAIPIRPLEEGTHHRADGKPTGSSAPPKD